MITFTDFIHSCANWHCQSFVSLYDYTSNTLLYRGEFYKIPKIILKHYHIQRFYVVNVEYRELSFLVRMNVDSAKKLIKHKYKGAII